MFALAGSDTGRTLEETQSRGRAAEVLFKLGIVFIVVTAITLTALTGLSS